MSPARALTVAGSDPGGGAGLQQDLKTFQALEVWGMAAITAITVQDTARVHGWEAVPAALVQRQIEVVVADIGVDAAKTGMLPGADTVEAVARALRGHLLVVDPVLLATSGDALSADDAAMAIRDVLVPGAALVTPNAREATVLTGVEVTDEGSQETAARALVQMGAGAALVTGGDLPGPQAADALFDGVELTWYRAERLRVGPHHGSGCMLSAAIAANLAKGMSLADAVARGKAFVTSGVETALDLGRGARPVNPGLS